MKKTILYSAIGVLSAIGSVAGAQEVGRVISSTPITQQVAVPRQVCGSQPMAVQQPNTGGGAVIGGLAGGAIGNQIGGGSGRAAATILGVVGGALLGNQIESNNNPAYVQNVQNCTTQTYYENRTVAYNVSYEYGGRQYTVQMPNDPGPTIPLQVTPMGGSYSASDAAAPYSPSTGQGVIVAPPVGQPIAQVVAPAPAYAYPAAYPAYPAYYGGYSPYYYPPVSLSLGFGFGFGGGRHGHWR